MTSPTALSDAFVIRGPEIDNLDAAQLQAHLAATCEAAHLAWPGIEVADLEFVGYLANLLVEANDFEALSHERSSELYICCACAGMAPGAIEAFESRYFTPALKSLFKISKDPHFHEEVAQRLRNKLFVADADDLPKICDFAGRGSLEGWVRITAVRIGLNMRRKTNREVGLDQVHLQAASDDVEMDFLKSKYRVEFREAFAEAITKLTPRERALLRLNTIDGASIDQIAALHDIHRSSAARWLKAARDHLGDATKEILGEKLKLSGDELLSVIRLIRSRIDVSIQRHLKE